MSAPQQSRPSWSSPAASIALVVFTVFIPFLAFAGVIGAASLFGGTQSDADKVTSFAWSLAAVVSLVIAFVLAVVAAMAGGRAARILVCITVPLSLVGLIVFGAMTASFGDRLPQATTPPIVAEPDCGPDSRPPFYGADSRYSPCDDALAIAEELLPAISAALPTDEVTIESLDAAAQALTSDGRLPDGIYRGSYAFDNGDVVARWNPAPVTCIVAEWQNDSWNVRVTGALVEGHAC
ncbi:MAG: hypothetical protein ACTHMQ_03060 [Protaetiibacter sp.]